MNKKYGYSKIETIVFAKSGYSTLDELNVLKEKGLKFNPDLIDIHDYEATLLLYRDDGIPPLPPPSIPSIAIGGWSCEEMEAMKKNRRLARAIYDRYKL